jgi:hypothetical protein
MRPHRLAAVCVLFLILACCWNLIGQAGTGLATQPLAGLFAQVTGTTVLWQGSVVSVNTQTVALTGSATNYLEFNGGTKIVDNVNTSFDAGAIPIAVVNTSNVGITSINDARPGWVAGSGASPAGPAGAVFLASTNPCTSVAGCLQLVDDDSTNNCGSSLTAWISSINSYAGPGSPKVLFYGSGSGKAFLFSNCNLVFTIPVDLDGDATFDAGTNTSANLIQFGPTGLSGFSNAQLPPYRLTGKFTFVGGADLTAAGIEAEQYISQVQIENASFVNFGAGNATLGNCTNYGMQFDGHNNEIGIQHIRWWSFDSTSGRCGINNASAAAGSNTARYNDIHMLSTAAPGFTTPCGSQGIVEGGSSSAITGSSLYGFGIDIRVAGPNAQISNVNLQSAGCTAKGKTGPIQYGANGSSTAIPGLVVFNNHVSEGSTDNFVQVAGDSTATLQAAQIVNNYNDGSTINLVPNGLTCTTSGTSQSFPGCNLTGNIGFTAQGGGSGWTLATYDVQGGAATGLTGNLSSTALYTPVLGSISRISCYVVETRAATSSSTLPSCSVGYTDLDTSVSESLAATQTSTANSVGTVEQGSVVIVNTTGGLTYSTSGYASSGATSMQYTVRVRTEIIY